VLASQRPERDLGRCGRIVELAWVGTQRGAGLEKLAGGQLPQGCPQLLGSGDEQHLERALQVGPVCDRAPAGHPQRPQRLDSSAAPLGCAGADPAERGPSRGFGVDRIGLALPAAGLAVGSIDLDQLNLLGLQKRGQAGAVGTGAFDPTSTRVPKLRSQPSSPA